MLDKHAAGSQYSSAMSRLKPALMRATAIVLMFIGGLIALRVFRHREIWRWPDDLVAAAAIVVTMGIGAVLDLRARKRRR